MNSKWYHLTDDEALRLNPPGNADDRPEWLPVGYIPRPTTRLGWFAYHVIHGLWMRYPPLKVLGYALGNTKPGELDYRAFALPTILLSGGAAVAADGVEWTENGPLFRWDVPFENANSSTGDPGNYVVISIEESPNAG